MIIISIGASIVAFVISYFFFKDQLDNFSKKRENYLINKIEKIDEDLMEIREKILTLNSTLKYIKIQEETSLENIEEMRRNNLIAIEKQKSSIKKYYEDLYKTTSNILKEKIVNRILEEILKNQKPQDSSIIEKVKLF